ncbi:hypothetical protein D3C86_1654280 [compost metagenome]
MVHFLGGVEVEAITIIGGGGAPAPIMEGGGGAPAPGMGGGGGGGGGGIVFVEFRPSRSFQVMGLFLHMLNRLSPSKVPAGSDESQRPAHGW